MPGGAQITRNLKILLATAVPAVLLDQVTKAAVMGRLIQNQAVEVIPGFFSVVFFKNPGAAFSLFHSGGALRTVFLISTSVAALIVIGVLLRRSKDPLISLSLSLIAGGAAGNLIDRIRFGWVVDFLYFHIGEYYWPAFNVADSAITAGVALAVFSYYLGSKEEG